MNHNFRKSYYSVLGVRSIEAKLSLESVLQSTVSVLDVDKLVKLCLWVRIPQRYRPLVWKVLLGVVSTDKQTWPRVDAVHAQHFADLLHAVLRLHDVPALQRDLSRDRSHVDGHGHVAEYDRHDRRTPALMAGPGFANADLDRAGLHTTGVDVDADVDDGDLPELTPLLMVLMLFVVLDMDVPLATWTRAPTTATTWAILNHLASLFLAVTDVERDAFWLFVAFVQTLAPLPGLPSLPGVAPQTASQDRERLNELRCLLASHHAGLAHFLFSPSWTASAPGSIGTATTPGATTQSEATVVESIVSEWFAAHFANVLPASALEGVWDLVLAGAPGILVYVALSLLLALRRKLEGCRSPEELARTLRGAGRFVDPEAVTLTAIELWEKPILAKMSRESRQHLDM
ncbi:hypothetical protein CXG81DRAFT_25052 [Caulochytrium protostelioides]|uniref:TBC1 domain family member 7 n=1 Tax=Caulochytrium protostelioides TaxID=1555241 RepID=A0A4P9WVY1_9FUNG|nr:hypothetical protein CAUPRSCDRAFT_11470 [Caulochytrium protostelioides]RKP02273.1 hypothetical protein CXG81DRAFT_25052 [Caulochytrium protostelioides]|eukprot:RKP02273.1 hypothetical protein CXG81DRAFT_25052 [Caulochytrium protostelioides]